MKKKVCTIKRVLTQELDPALPQLYLCSQRDMLIPFEQTRQFITGQEELHKRYQDQHPLFNPDKLQLQSNETQKVCPNEALILNRFFSKSCTFMSFTSLFSFFIIQLIYHPQILGKLDRAGKDIFVKDFVDTHHVNHLRPRYDEYSAIVKSFMEYALRKSQDKPRI